MVSSTFLFDTNISFISVIGSGPSGLSASAIPPPLPTTFILPEPPAPLEIQNADATIYWRTQAETSRAFWEAAKSVEKAAEARYKDARSNYLSAIQKVVLNNAGRSNHQARGEEILEVGAGDIIDVDALEADANAGAGAEEEEEEEEDDDDDDEKEDEEDEGEDEVEESEDDDEGEEEGEEE
jgi:hypothetical protein